MWLRRWLGMPDRRWMEQAPTRVSELPLAPSPQLMRPSALGAQEAGAEALVAVNVVELDSTVAVVVAADCGRRASVRQCVGGRCHRPDQCSGEEEGVHDAERTI